MTVDVEAAEQFVLANARLLDRHRLAALLTDGSVEPVIQTLRAYRNSDGGFGHALEPDIRGPESEPAATFHALEVLAETGSLGDPMVAAAASWTGTIAEPDGGIPFVLPTSEGYPHAPWMVSGSGGSHLTFALAARLWEAASEDEWLELGTKWCWTSLEVPEDLGGYWVKFALDFLDHVRDPTRALAVVESIRPLLGPDGSIPVEGGTADEHLTPLVISPKLGSLSRTLFTDDQINADLDRLERAQQADGGWMFDWLGWSEGQIVEWRGALTVQSLRTLKSHDRI